MCHAGNKRGRDFDESHYRSRLTARNPATVFGLQSLQLIIDISAGSRNPLTSVGGLSLSFGRARVGPLDLNSQWACSLCGEKTLILHW